MYCCIAFPLTWRLALDFGVILHHQVANVAAVENILADQSAAFFWRKFPCISRLFKIKSLVMHLTPVQWKDI
jgi:hypothetical protein